MTVSASLQEEYKNTVDNIVPYPYDTRDIMVDVGLVCDAWTRVVWACLIGNATDRG
jgi:hypothetical protein